MLDLSKYPRVAEQYQTVWTGPLFPMLSLIAVRLGLDTPKDALRRQLEGGADSMHKRMAQDIPGLVNKKLNDDPMESAGKLADDQRVELERFWSVFEKDPRLRVGRFLYDFMENARDDRFHHRTDQMTPKELERWQNDVNKTARKLAQLLSGSRLDRAAAPWDEASLSGYLSRLPSIAEASLEFPDNKDLELFQTAKPRDKNVLFRRFVFWMCRWFHDHTGDAHRPQVALLAAIAHGVPVVPDERTIWAIAPKEIFPLLKH